MEAITIITMQAVITIGVIIRNRKATLNHMPKVIRQTKEAHPVVKLLLLQVINNANMVVIIMDMVVVVDKRNLDKLNKQ